MANYRVDVKTATMNGTFVVEADNVNEAREICDGVGKENGWDTESLELTFTKLDI